ncbi:MAG: cell division protein FtsZ [Euryarchaeota archaeon]|nr:cell division protein FtsZ [Euryarchaeota archaeon]
MQSLITNAIKNAPDTQGEEAQTTETDFEFEGVGEPKIVIVGCGGAGNNTINRLHSVGVRGAETIAINTDKQHLDRIQADKKLLIGKSITRGLGAGGYPEVAERCAEMAQPYIEELLEGADLVFVTAGMGGGTGTGTAPVVARIAKKKGAIVIGMVSTPFNVERARLLKGEDGLNKLRKEADTVIVLDNNRLLQYVPNLPIDQAFSVMDQLVAETVKGISETITQPSLINLDYADVRTIMGCGGIAVMLYGEAKSNDPNKVVSEALNHPLLDVDYKGASGCLLHITGGPDLSLKAAEQVAQALTFDMDTRANVIWGARVNEDFEGRMRVMAIMTGVQSPQILGPGATATKALRESLGNKKDGPNLEIPWIN